MRSVLAAGTALAAGVCAASSAFAMVRIDVDLSAQRMHVESAKGENFDWPISSGKPGAPTPRGVFSPKAMYRIIYSWKYDNEPMPYSIFFLGNFAIHGSREIDLLGHPVSHGCVRLAPWNAATLFDLVRQEGAMIRIDGDPPGQRPPGNASDRAYSP